MSPELTGLLVTGVAATSGAVTTAIVHTVMKRKKPVVSTKVEFAKEADFEALEKRVRDAENELAELRSVVDRVEKIDDRTYALNQSARTVEPHAVAVRELIDALELQLERVERLASSARALPLPPIDVSSGGGGKG